MFLVPFGRIADIRGRKRVFLYGMAVDALASILWWKSGTWLIALRAMQELGGAIDIGTGVAILTSVFPPREPGRALGINVAAVYTVVSAWSAAFFRTSVWDGEAFFFLNALLGVVVVITVLWKLKAEWVGAKGEKFDLTGAITYSLSLVAIMSGFSELPCLGFYSSCDWCSRTRGLYPLQGRLSNIPYSISTFLSTIKFLDFPTWRPWPIIAQTFAVAFMLSLYLQYIKNFTAEHAGLILVTQPIMTSFAPHR